MNKNPIEKGILFLCMIKSSNQTKPERFHGKQFTKNLIKTLLSNGDVKELFCQQFETVINQILQAELASLLGYDPYERSGFNTNSYRNGQYFRSIERKLLAFFALLAAVCPTIYSTNIIESLNKKIRRKTKAKEQFLNEKSLDSFIGVQVISYNEKNFNRIHRGFGQVKDTLESLSS